MREFREAIYTIVEDNRPCSVRQVYYVGIGRLWEKDTAGSRASYKSVVREIGVMRETGELPWSWITDATRYVRIATMFDSAEEAMARWAESYRRDLWSRQPHRVEVWAESDSVAGILDPVTRPLGVGLFSCRGQASKTFAYDSAATYRRLGKPVTILYCGDWDPTGLSIPRSLRERLERYSDGVVPIGFHRLAITANDVASGQFVTHDVNTGDSKYRSFATECRDVGLDPQTAVEVEAIPPPQLRQRVEDAIYALVADPEAWNATLAAEESEREILTALANGTVTP